MPATDWIDAAVSCADAAVSATDAARLVVFAVTCSIDAAISLTDDTSCSLELGDRLRLAGRLLQRRRHLGRCSPSALSSERSCMSAPSATSSAMRAIAPALDTVTCSACGSTRRGVECAERRALRGRSLS